MECVPFAVLSSSKRDDRPVLMWKLPISPGEFRSLHAGYAGAPTLEEALAKL